MQSDHDDVTRSVQGLEIGGMFGRYRILRHLGAGGMGNVFLAEDTELHRQVALKFLVGAGSANSELRARFVREAQAAARLNHPNIVTVYEVGEQSGRPYIAMEHVDGHSLHHHAHAQPLPLEHVLDLIAQVADGLAKAHQNGVIHRDIKCANIIVDTDGRARILDFGLATMHDADHLTRPGTTLGTVAYMSPEQVRGQEVDYRSDLFSLGVVLYELIAGRTPFKRDTEPATLQAILSEEPEPLSRYKAGVPAELQRVLDKALEKDRALRYQSAADFGADLRRVKRGMADSAPAVAPAVPAPPPPARKKSLLRVAIPGSIVVALIVVALVLKPWHFEIHSTDKAVAAENRLAVMYFDNVANPQDPERLGEIITNLAITGLSETKSLQVVSSQRLYDILKQLGREGEKKIDRDVATQVAQKAQASKMLTGSILQTSPRLVVTAQIIDVASGQVVSSQRLTGEPTDDVFALVDKLNDKVKSDLAIPAAGSEAERAVADVTTHSQEAYRLYLEAEELTLKLYFPQARQKYLAAIAADSTFVKPYLALARNSDEPRRLEFIEKAMKYTDRVSETDRQVIKATYDRLHGDFESYQKILKQLCKEHPDDKSFFTDLGLSSFDRGMVRQSVPYLERSIELDPLNKFALNQLVYSRFLIGDTTGAFDAAEHYASLVPQEPNPYDTRGDLYLFIGQIDRAIESFQIALRKDSTFFQTRLKLANLYRFLGQEDQAHLLEEQLLKSQSPAPKGAGRACQAAEYVFRGQFREAATYLQEALRQDTVDDVVGIINKGKIALAITTAYNRGLVDDAARLALERERTKQDEAASSAFPLIDQAVEILARAGRQAEADRMLADYKRRLAKEDEEGYARYLLAIGRMQLVKGDRAAVRTLEQSVDTFHGRPWFARQYSLGRAYLLSGQPDKAIEAFEAVGQGYDEYWVVNPAQGANYHYYLALAYEQAGQKDKAVAQYTRYLDIMREADPGIAEVDDARTRLQALTSRT